MATKLVFKLQLPPLVNEQLNDNGGNWQYVGANAVEQASGTTVQLVAMKRDNSVGKAQFSASMLTATILYPKPKKSAVSPNLTIQGVHDLTSNNETGSVSSASSEFAEYIGGQFTFNASRAVLTIHPRR
jgi:hypothetical protein